jgi:hypothetical protein
MPVVVAAGVLTVRSSPTFLLCLSPGEMIKSLRAQQLAGDATATGLGKWAASNFGLINNSVPKLLNTVSFAHKVSQHGVVGVCMWVGGGV